MGLSGEIVLQKVERSLGPERGVYPVCLRKSKVNVTGV